MGRLPRLDRNQSSANDCLIEFRILKYAFESEILPSRDIFRRTAISPGVTEYRLAPAKKRLHVASRLSVRGRGYISGANSGYAVNSSSCWLSCRLRANLNRREYEGRLLPDSIKARCEAVTPTLRPNSRCDSPLASRRNLMSSPNRRFLFIDFGVKTFLSSQTSANV
jgi:hypothetical protein